MLRDSGDSGLFVFGLEHVPLPALTCESSGRILWCNERMSEAVGAHKTLPGTNIFDHVRLSDRNVESLTDLRDKGGFDAQIGEVSFALHVGPVGDLLACVLAPKTRTRTHDSSPRRLKGEPLIESPTGSKLLEAFIYLSRKLNLTVRESELVRLFIRVYDELFPGRLVCLQLVDTDTQELRQVYANSRLLPDRREVLQLTRAECTEHGLIPDLKPLKNRVRVVEHYENIFAEGLTGFAVPLYDGQSFYGMLRFEYGQDDGAMATDKPLVIPLAHQMCAALRNAGSMAETVFLKDYLAKLLDHANAPVLVVDRNRRLTVVNQAFEQLTGHDRYDILGKDICSLLPAPDQLKIIPLISSAMRGEPKKNIELVIPRADCDKRVHFSFNTAGVLSGDGVLESVVFVGQDLTEIKALQSQVIHSEKLATLGQIAAGVAHELNNPLTSISVYGDYLCKRLGPELDRADALRLKRITEAAERIRDFTKDLVAYARPSGEEPTLIRTSDLLERAVSFCEHVIDESRAELRLLKNDTLGPIYGIQGQLEQVFVNLITNACHALPEDGGQIDIAVEDGGEERIAVRISDTGHGIPADQLEEIFEPFYTTKPEGKGTGLGLSIVRNILVNHDAKIHVSSEPGRGTTFTVLMYTG